MNRSHFSFLIILLLLSGSGLFAYKAYVLGFPLKPDVQSPIWNIEARISFHGRLKPTKVKLFIPTSSEEMLVLDERFISSGYGLISNVESPNRQAIWSIRKAQGEQALYYRAVVHSRPSNGNGSPGSTTVSKPDAVDLDDASLFAAKTVIEKITERSADIDGLVRELLKEIRKKEPSEEIALLKRNKKTDDELLGLAVQILSYARISARSVHGIQLTEDSRDVNLVHWLEVHDSLQKKWISFQLKGSSGVPDDYFAWWRGEDPIVALGKGEPVRIRLSVTRSNEYQLKAALNEGRTYNPLFFELSTFNLPISVQLTYQLLFMIPIGGFVVVILRNIVGINTFGTFMPVLIALAFRETQLIWGIVLFLTIISLGLMVRFYFERFKLLLVPRLNAGLIVVILLMATVSIVANKLGIEHGLSVSLFPMVILTMTIERMSIVWEEQGGTDAVRKAFGSLFASVLCYLVMSIEILKHLLFVFPELLLILLAMALLLGRYTGYRLVELRRFKTLSEI